MMPLLLPDFVLRRPDGRPPERPVLSWCFNLFMRLVTGKSITDSPVRFFAVRRDIICRNWITIGYSGVMVIDYIRLMYYLQEQWGRNFAGPCRQWPASQRERGTSQHSLKVFAQYTKETFSLVWRERIKRRLRAIKGQITWRLSGLLGPQY